jgi:hypothetical protein
VNARCGGGFLRGKEAEAEERFMISDFRERQSDPKQRIAVAVDCLADFGVDVVRMAAACQPSFAFSRA